MGYLSEKFNYLKGLADGLDLGSNTKETKVLQAIIELMDDMILSIEDLEESRDETNEMLDELDEDLAALEDAIYGKEDDEEDFTYGEVECPECNALINLDSSLFSEDGDKITCPSCGKDIDIEWQCDCDDSDCCCGDEDEQE